MWRPTFLRFPDPRPSRRSAGRTLWALPLALALSVTAGCDAHADDGDAHGHEEGGHHAHDAPRGGTLVELGDEFAHLELVVDRAAGRMTLYVLDGEAALGVRVGGGSLDLALDAPAAHADRVVTLTGVASGLTGETADDTSEFAADDDAFRGGERIAGRVVGLVVRGIPFPDVRFEVPGAP